MVKCNRAVGTPKIGIWPGKHVVGIYVTTRLTTTISARLPGTWVLVYYPERPHYVGFHFRVT